MHNKSFFVRDESNPDILHPTPSAVGPWDPSMMHGRVLCGLVVHGAEQLLSSNDELDFYQAVRVTVDMFRFPVMKPLKILSEVVRDGKRIKVIEVHVMSINDDQLIEIVKGSVVWLLKTDDTKGKVWMPDEWQFSSPNEDMPFLDEKTLDNPGHQNPIWETLDAETGRQFNLSHQTEKIGAKTAWIRETHEFIENENTSSLLRVAQIADYANPLANLSNVGLEYINVDVTLYLQRNPIGSWIGVETLYHGASKGVSVGSMNIYDSNGRIGMSTVAGLAQSKSMK
ncbi:MAG: acyl-CoA thioesterase domain-containing protein [Dehalococcoidia bacterium]